MKTKPSRHKETNTFQFKPFSERVTEIDIDVFHRVAHRNEDDLEEVETYFHQTLQKWNVLNLTEGYTTFKRQVHDIVTLPQLLHKKQYVIDILTEYLKKRDILFLQPILELIVATARDLQKEFYEYFPEFLSEIICLLQTKDTDQIEYTFTCLAYLFKILWRYLVKNIKTVITLLLPLLADTQPAYINKFAAESFAFVVRKVKDKDSFLRLVLHILEDNTSGVLGCGKLLFEVVAGTPGQFHSCAEDMLLLYFNALQDECVNQLLIYETLKEIVVCILQNIHSQKCGIIWKVILKVTDGSIKKSKQAIETEASDREDILVLLLRFIHIIVSHKNGKFLLDAEPVIKQLIIMIETFSENNGILQEVINVSAAILLAASVNVSQEVSSQLLLKIMAINNVELIYSAVENLMHYASFEILILPHILRRSILIGFDSKILSLFAKIIIAKASPCLSGINLVKWKKYILDIRNIGTESINYLVSELKTLSTDAVSLDAMRALIILPHLKPLHEGFKETLKNVLLSLYNVLEDANPETTIDYTKITFIFLLTLESIMHISEPIDLHDIFIKSNIKLQNLVNKCDNEFILNSIDLCLTYFVTSQHRLEYINSVSFNALNNTLVKKVSSPYSRIRLTTAHLYSLFVNVEGMNWSMQDSQKCAMELVYLAECESATVQKYRDKLSHLQALEFQGHALINLDSKYYEFPLRCLLGNLYINFSLLWEPVSTIIAGYANAKCPQFWPTFLDELMSDGVPRSEWKPSFDCPTISSLELLIAKHDDKPDFENRKILLWKCMAHFPHYAETKNRDLTGSFINYVNANLFKSNSEDGKSCNIEKRNESSNENDDTLEESDEEEQPEITDDKKKKLPNANNGRYKVKLLIAQMEVFDKAINPRMLYREAEMHQIYLDLLSSRNIDIQKAALNCLFAYKYKYLLPYKESLYGLISEKNFKNELTRFKLDHESNVIQGEHREDLMPIIMRIIYAKMAAKTGMRTGGKGGGIARRKIILRFLGGTWEDEMIVFIKMAFKPFKSTLEAGDTFDLKRHTDGIVDAVDLNNVTPPKRMQSAANLLGIIIEQFGGNMTLKLLPHLLGILLSILAEVTGILRRAEDVYSGYLSTIKNVRSNCIGILARFFVHFDNYDWKQHEIDAVYSVAVFPWLEKLPVEGIHSPTALLKLFMAWSQNSRYYPLFLKHRQDDELVSPLPFIVKLLSYPKTHQCVVNAILEMMEKMLTLRDYGKSDEDEHAMEVDAPFVPLVPILTDLLKIEEEMLLKGINYGSVILLPHVPSILEFIRNKLKQPYRSLNRTELAILSRISEFATKAETCDTLLTLLLPILVKKTMSNENEQTVMQLLTTVTNLVRIVDKPEIHLRSTIAMLGFVSDVPARKLVLQLYSTIVERSKCEDRETMTRNCEVVIALNSWDRKWIDQPDYQRRLDAFRQIDSMAGDNTIILEFGVAIIYNCFYFLKTESDLGMKDYSGQCLKLVSAKLAMEHRHNPSNRRYVIDDTILGIARKGITSKNEVVRLHLTSLLRHMALECANAHPILLDLSLLVNRADPEVDFFENIQHLQLHRRARALLKFCAFAKALRKPMNCKTLTQFILPLCTSYLCNEAYIHKNSIIDAAIETVGVVCKFLPWHHYEIILKYYLGKLRNSMEFQKQVVRIVVAILDSFHYDLSKYKPVKKMEEIKSALTDIENAAPEVSEHCDTDEKKLDEELNDDCVENTEEIIVEKDCETTKEDVPIIERPTLLSQYGAKRIVYSISHVLLPQLHRSIAVRTRQESSHKVNRKKIASETEEDDLMRVPIALALVKLLQKLPEGILDTNLPGIFMKLCTFLKSRMDSVRRATREILQKIMITLGPKYLHHLLKETNTLLTKGFQVHVLVYTVHSVLVALKPSFQKYDINENLQSVLSVCKIDLFGLTAEEKEVAGIVRSVSEARNIKSFDIFHILAEFISDSCLLDLILPLRETLSRTHSHKTIHKVTECLRNVMLGLADNTYIPIEQMLIFIYGIISKSIPDIIPEEGRKKTVARETKLLAQEKPDCFIIPPEPKSRMGIKATAKTTKDTNTYVLVEFGLKLYHILLKRDKVSGTEYKPYLEPFVSILSDCLHSQHIKLNTVALQCLNWMFKMDLTSIHVSISDICASMFDILHKYAAAGLSKGSNFDLVMATFKCMSVIVRDVKHFNIDENQLRILILYVEQDLHDSDKQATAFNLLKSIISRKMIITEMLSVMEKVAALSVTSESEHVRLQSRSVFYSYLMEYPLGKHLDKHISFYLTQLSYEMQPGRLSALEMIHSIIAGFPLKALTARTGVMFLMLGARLINDDDPICRKLSAKCLKEMISRIPLNERNKLFDVVLKWLNDRKIMHRTLAAQLCSIFVAIEKNSFQSRLVTVLPLILKQFHTNFYVSNEVEPGRFVKLNNTDNATTTKDFNSKDPERAKDHHLFQVLQFLLKTSAHCTSLLANKKYQDSVSLLAQHSQSLLAYPHIWVRFAATQLLGFILAALDVDKVVELANNPSDRDESETGYMYANPVDTLRSLVLDLVAQLYPDMTFEELADQVVKNLIFIAKILKSVDRFTEQDNVHDNENEAKDSGNLSLHWLIRRLRKAINVEITQAPKSTSVRTAVFKFIAGTMATVPIEYLNKILFNIMSPLVREMTVTEETNTELRQLAKEVATMIKKSIGNDEYAVLLNRVQQKLDIKKAERKRVRAQQYVVNPELAAKHKIARQQRKKEAQKRKMNSIKGKKIVKRRRKEVDLDEL